MSCIHFLIPFICLPAIGIYSGICTLFPLFISVCFFLKAILSAHWPTGSCLVFISLFHSSVFAFSWNSFRHLYLLCYLWYIYLLFIIPLHLRFCLIHSHWRKLMYRSHVAWISHVSVSLCLDISIYIQIIWYFFNPSSSLRGYICNIHRGLSSELNWGIFFLS